MSKSFNEINSIEDYSNLLVIDGLNLGFRYKHLGKKQFAEEYIRTVQSFAKSYEAKKIIITGDGGSNYRYNLFPEYKNNRKILKDNQTEEEAKDFEEFLKEMDRAFSLLEIHYLVLKYKGLEADDIAAYITKYYSNKFEHTWLISSDKDWDLLIKDNVSRFSFRTRKEVTLDNWNEHYNYKPEEHISVKVLQGDKGDNVPGVPGIGDKRAIVLINKYGSALDIHNILPINQKQKYIQNLNEFGDTILLNYELMDLLSYCEEAIGANVIDIEDKLKGYLQ